jgi:glycerate kinase
LFILRTADENSDCTGFIQGEPECLDVATAIEAGFQEIYPDAEYVKLPVADGGEGTVEAMVAATQGSGAGYGYRSVEQTGRRFYGLSGDERAFIEMAAASGLESVPPAP